MSEDYIKVDEVFIKKNLNFLIVEDNTILSELIREMLNNIGFNGELYEANNLKDAIKTLDSQKVDYILSDWGLPDGEGINLLSAIRKSPKYSKIPFVMITAKNDVDSMIEASRLKTSDYLTKPFTADEFLETLANGWTQEDS